MISVIASAAWRSISGLLRRVPFPPRSDEINYERHREWTATFCLNRVNRQCHVAMLYPHSEIGRQ